MRLARLRPVPRWCMGTANGSGNKADIRCLAIRLIDAIAFLALQEPSAVAEAILAEVEVGRTPLVRLQGLLCEGKGYVVNCHAAWCVSHVRLSGRREVYSVHCRRELQGANGGTGAKAISATLKDRLRDLMSSLVA